MLSKNRFQYVILFLIVLNALSFINRVLFSPEAFVIIHVFTLFCICAIILVNGISERKDTIYMFCLVALDILICTMFTDGLLSVFYYSLIPFLSAFAFRRIVFDDFVIKLLLLFFLLLFIAIFFKSIIEQIPNNSLSMRMLYCSMYIIVFLRIVKIKSKYIFEVLILCLSFISIIASQSRNCVLGLLFFIISNYIIPKRIWQKKSFSIFFLIAIIVLGYALPYIYLSLRANDIEVVLPLISKHFFSGRQLIWEQFFSDINRSLAIKLFGMGESYRVVIGSRVVGNLHNIFLTLLQYIGIVGSSLFFALLIKFISGMYKDTAPSADQITMYIIFLTSLVIGFFEISFFLSYLSFPAAISLGFACNPTLSARIPKQRRL